MNSIRRFERPVPPNPPGSMVQCSCGRIVRQEVWDAEHTQCAGRVQRIGSLIAFMIVFGTVALALACNRSIPWPWNP